MKKNNDKWWQKLDYNLVTFSFLRIKCVDRRCWSRGHSQPPVLILISSLLSVFPVLTSLFYFFVDSYLLQFYFLLFLLFFYFSFIESRFFPLQYIPIIISLLSLFPVPLNLLSHLDSNPFCLLLGKTRILTDISET